MCNWGDEFITSHKMDIIAILPGIIVVILIKYLINVFPTSSIGYYQQSNLCLVSLLLVYFQSVYSHSHIFGVWWCCHLA